MSALPDNLERQITTIKAFAIFPFWVIFRIRRETRKLPPHHPWYRRKIGIREFSRNADPMGVQLAMLLWFLIVISLNAAFKIFWLVKGCK